MKIERYRGDTAADSITITYRSGTVIDLTGCTVILTVNSELNPTDTANQVFSLTGTSPDPTNGIVLFYPDSTQADHVGVYYYDIQLTDSSGYKRTVAKDTYLFIQDISK